MEFREDDTNVRPTAGPVRVEKKAWQKPEARKAAIPGITRNALNNIPTDGVTFCIS